MKFGVITFPGTNGDKDLIHALSQGLGQQVVSLWHKSLDIEGCDCLCLAGGFAFGDYSGAGAIASRSPIMQAVKKHALAGGYVMGICNGFQILTQAGLLEGSLLENEKGLFMSQNAYIMPNPEAKLFSKLPPRPYKMPIANGFGRFYCEKEKLEALEKNGQILFRYCDEEGNTNASTNPNASLANIAAICNPQGNVWAMMPHPERACNSLLGSIDGQILLEAFLNS